MKKSYILIILLLIMIFLIGCHKKEEPLPKSLIISNKNISSTEDIFKYNINYPNIQQIEIDEYIEKEIMMLLEKLKHNYLINQAYLNIDYQSFDREGVISFLFNIKIIKDNKNIKEIIRTYNFDIINNQLIILNDRILQDIYLPILNEKLKSYKLNLNLYDLKILKYIIKKNEITFIIPKEVTRKEDIQIIIGNQGDDYVSITEPLEEEPKKYVAITFDDGPSNSTIDLVNLINKYNVKATFFLLGNNVKRYPQAVKYIYENNYEIGNHSYSHSDFTKISIDEVEYEIDKTQEVIYDLIQSYPKVFRFPYGKYNDYILNFINYPIILWNCDSEDWRSLDKNIIFRNVLKDLSDNSIIIFHDFTNYRKESIENIIKYLKEENYEFVTISELFNFHKEENIIYGKIYR